MRPAHSASYVANLYRLLEALHAVREPNDTRPETEAHGFELLAPHVRNALKEVDSFLGLDCSFLLVRDVAKAVRISILSTTADKDTVFRRHEDFPTGSAFLAAIASRTELMAEMPLDRGRFPNDGLWRLLWETMNFGPYAGPWSLVGVALCPGERQGPISEHNMIGCLILIGRGRWHETAPPLSLDLLAQQFQIAVELIRATRQLEATTRWTASGYARRAALPEQWIVLHGVLAPLQRMELKAFLSEQSLARGDTRNILRHLNDIRSQMMEVKRGITTFLDMGVQLHVSEGATENQSRVPLTDAGRTIEAVIDDLQGLAQREGKRFIARLHDVPSIPMKKDDFELIVSNILHNAVKYSYPGTKIKIGYYDRRPDLIIDFTSYGIQIEEHERELIFHLGYRTARAAKIEYAAGGVGLFAAREAARRWGGQLFVNASELEGRTPHGEMYRNTFRLAVRMRGRRHS